jgi:DNA-binding MarR family transcriptional regulator
MNDLSPETHLDIFLRATRIVAARLEQAFAGAGAVSTREAAVLASISRAPERRMRMDDLSRDLLMDKSTVSRLVDRLELAGLVERLASNHDRRAVYAAMTSEGRNALRHVTRVFRSNFEGVFLSGLTSVELNQMTEFLRRLYLANSRLAETSGLGPVARASS